MTSVSLRNKVGDGEGPGADAGAGDISDATMGARAERKHLPRLAAELQPFRDVADSLALPVAIVDARGDLVYYNRSAELVLGQPYTRRLSQAEWSELWSPTNLEGEPIPAGQLPLIVALRERRPAHGWLTIASLDGVSRRLEVTAFPLQTGDRSLGAVALFWQVDAH
jgi:PAS domain-containing protein